MKNKPGMAKIKLFIAATIDGYIAREDGSLDWLTEFPNPDQLDYGYSSLLEEVDVLVMGRKTYEEVLGFGIAWPYSNMKSFVVTSQQNYRVKTDNTFVLDELNERSIEQLKSSGKKHTWLVGGGKLISEFINLHAIDEIILSIIPILLGKGIRLFPGETREMAFDLVKTESFETGIVNLTYYKK